MWRDYTLLTKRGKKERKVIEKADLWLLGRGERAD